MWWLRLIIVSNVSSIVVAAAVTTTVFILLMVPIRAVISLPILISVGMASLIWSIVVMEIVSHSSMSYLEASVFNLLLLLR